MDPGLWRLRWLAQLEVARARLWWAYTAMSADQLGGPPVWDDWTAKDILVHLAFWDSRAAEWLQRAADDRLGTAPLPFSQSDYATLNARQHQRHPAISLDAAIAMCLKERQGFLNALQATPDSRLDAEVLWSGQPTPLRLLVQWRAQHDTAHAADVMAWRAAQPPAQGPAVILLAALRAWRRTLNALSALPIQSVEAVARDENKGLRDLAAWAKFARRGLSTPPWLAWDLFRSEPDAVSWRGVEDAMLTLIADITALAPDDLAQPQPDSAGQLLSRYSWLLEGQALAAVAVADLCQRHLAL